jgi:hypothetical protein
MHLRSKYGYLHDRLERCLEAIPQLEGLSDAVPRQSSSSRTSCNLSHSRMLQPQCEFCETSAPHKDRPKGQHFSMEH